MSLDRKILERIEKENLRIKPRWFFAVKDMFFGTGVVLLSVMGSLSLALLFEIVKQQGESLTWLNAPYAWVILLGIFLVASYWLVTKIDLLYKIKFVPIVSMLFFISLSFGYLTFASGKAAKIELELEKIPIYDIIIPIRKDVLPDTIEKSESSNENKNVNDEEKKNDDNIKEDSKSTDSDENDKVNIRESNFKVEIKEENEDDEIKESEKTGNIDEDEDEDKDEDEDDTLKGEVKGVSKEINKDEDEEIEEIEEEKSDSDDEISEDSLEESETDSLDAVDED